MATLAGHGLGAKLALAVGCYHAERVTGVFAIDSTPTDQRYHEAFKEVKGYVNALTQINFKTWSDKEVKEFLKENIKVNRRRLSVVGQLETQFIFLFL